ncbi:TerB family tellurite resistance protein [Sulfurimonas sp. MAG313]|nr:TerB family tellurite resistance protein [Sulfurimonas sp. MAG313]MDF1882211.1 TerB family tellurite resistance protein [Sulfurimonas sp. MAG313]
MLNIIIWGIVFYVFYRVYKSYKTFQHVYYTQAQFKNMTITKEAIAQSELGLFTALCAKVAKADGHIDELEAELIGNMFNDISKVFPEPHTVKAYLKEIFSEEKQRPRNLDSVVSQLYVLVHRDKAKRQMMMSFLIHIAFIDGKVTAAEENILTKIAAFLHFSGAELEAMMKHFQSSFSEVKTQSSIAQAYETLGANAEDDLKTIKKKYRSLVKKYHPDIIQAQGADEHYIEDAMQKTQGINEAYEIIKKEKG